MLGGAPEVVPSLPGPLFPLPHLYLPGVQAHPLPDPGPAEAPSYTRGPPSGVSASPQARLLKEGMLNPGAVRMISDMMKENAEFFKSFLESGKSDILFFKDDE